MIASLLLCCAGFAAIACSMSRYQQKLFGKRHKLKPLSTAIKCLGFILLSLAAVTSCLSLGLSNGLVLWVAYLALAHLFISLGLSRLS